jgi:two-component system sensor histidine kinase KdpD
MKNMPVRVGLSLALICCITAVFHGLLSVNMTTAGFAYLMGVLWIAASWGIVEAVFASFLAMLCFNFYFIPPIGHLTIADPQNWVALFTFLGTALVASHLSDRAKKQAIEAQMRQRETEQLYALSRAILLSPPDRSMNRQAVTHIAQVFGFEAVALYDAVTGDIAAGGPEDMPEVEGKLKQVAVHGSSQNDPANGVVTAAITLGGKPVGSLAFKGRPLSDGATQALLNLVAIALERVRTEEAVNRAEVSRQSEEFKSTLLDAIAHEFKTPLTSIRAASTSILSDAHMQPEALHELTAIIDEETERLSRLVSEAVRMAKIDAGKLELEKQPLDLAVMGREVLEYFGPYLDGRPVSTSLPSGLPYILGDRELISLALRQLIDNALKYSPSTLPIDLSVREEGEQVAILVRDHGPGVGGRDIERVFERFYRRDPGKHRVPGSGLGLHIAREIVRAHGGDITVRNAEGGGAEFAIRLPAIDVSGESDNRES